MVRASGKEPPLRRRPRSLPTIAAIVGVVLTAAAGNWQLNRAHEKERLRAAYEQGVADAPVHLTSEAANVDDLRLRRVEVSGEFVARAMVLLDNRVRNGQPGFEVIMPMQVAGGPMHVLVDRGWIAAGRDRNQLPAIKTPGGMLKIVGIATVPGRFFELSKNQDADPVWQNLTIERFYTRRNMQVQPVVVQQQNELDDGLLRSTQPPDFGTSKHYGYAGQWFLFCGLIVFLYVYFHVKPSRPKKDEANAPPAGRT